MTATPTADRSLGRHRYSFAAAATKRVGDLVVAGIALTLLSPLWLAIAIAIRVGSPGPAIFRQTRVGVDGCPFTMLKFRTMRVGNDDRCHRRFVTDMLTGTGRPAVDEPEAGPFKLVDDPRITSVGRWLRRASLDEVPQLLNVLRGEMTLVGPRPMLPFECELLDRRQRARQLSVPGLTSLAQVEGRSDLHMLDALELDLRYVEQCSLWGDVRILARTFGVVATGSGW